MTDKLPFALKPEQVAEIERGGREIQLTYEQLALLDEHLEAASDNEVRALLVEWSETDGPEEEMALFRKFVSTNESEEVSGVSACICEEGHLEVECPSCGTTFDVEASKDKVVELLTQGLSLRDVAARTGLSKSTVERIKASGVPGGAPDIVIYASYQLVRTLIEHGLVDEFRLVIFPVMLGVGERLFAQIGVTTPLRLVRTETIGDGLPLLTYEVVRAA